MASYKDLDLSRATDANKKKALTYAIEVRKSEIDRFWSRTLVFWGFVAATFVAYGVLYDKAKDPNDPTLLTVCCFGFLTSLGWALQNRGSKYWQEAWERKVEILEADVLKIDLFSNKEEPKTKLLWGAGRFSVSKIAIALSYLSMFTWLGLACRAYLILTPDFNFFGVLPELWDWVPSKGNGIALATAVYASFLLIFGRSGNSN